MEKWLLIFKTGPNVISSRKPFPTTQNRINNWLACAPLEHHTCCYCHIYHIISYFFIYLAEASVKLCILEDKNYVFIGQNPKNETKQKTL